MAFDGTNWTRLRNFPLENVDMDPHSANWSDGTESSDPGACVSSTPGHPASESMTIDVREIIVKRLRLQPSSPHVCPTFPVHVVVTALTARTYVVQLTSKGTQNFFVFEVALVRELG